MELEMYGCDAILSKELLTEISKRAPGDELSRELCCTLFHEAKTAREMAYAPYSNFFVGAALVDLQGRIYRGCNIENGAFSPTNCAERTAIFKAISSNPKRQFVSIAVVGGDREGIRPFCTPCGVCRQVMAEFCDPESFMIIMYDKEGNYRQMLLKELLPLGFGL